MPTGLVTWWMEQMRELVPASLRHFPRTWRPAVVAVVRTLDEPVVDLSVQGRRGGTSLGRFALNDPALRNLLARMPKARRRASVLQVSPDVLLEREVVLPLGAETDLRRVVSYEMDHLTPFSADEVFWTCVVQKRDVARNQIIVQLAIVPRVQMQPVLTALRQAGLVPARIETCDAAGPRRAIPLNDDRRDRSWLGPRTEAAALACCGVLAAAAVALPLVQQSVASATLDEEIAAVKPQVTEVEALRKKIASAATSSGLVAAASSKVGSALQAVALLTDIVPDDTYLTALSMRGRKVTFSGRSAAAARLIGAMASNTQVHNPAFTAPVIRDDANGGEMFSIQAELGP